MGNYIICGIFVVVFIVCTVMIIVDSFKNKEKYAKQDKTIDYLCYKLENDTDYLAYLNAKDNKKGE